MQFAAEGSGVGPLKPFILPIGKLKHLVQTFRNSGSDLDYGHVFDHLWIKEKQSSGSVLAQFWLSSGSVLAQFWLSSGSGLAQFWLILVN